MNNLIVKSISYFVFFTLVILLSCQKYEFNKGNLKSFHGIDEWVNSKNSLIPSENCKSMNARLLNNPFELDSNVYMILSLDTTLIYRGRFKDNFNICIPDSIFSKRYVYPKISFFYDSKTYMYMSKTRSEIHLNDKFIYFIFFTNEFLEVNCVMFSQQYPIY
jgi:hypothetical protein